MHVSSASHAAARATSRLNVTSFNELASCLDRRINVRVLPDLAILPHMLHVDRLILAEAAALHLQRLLGGRHGTGCKKELQQLTACKLAHRPVGGQEGSPDRAVKQDIILVLGGVDNTLLQGLQ